MTEYACDTGYQPVPSTLHGLVARVTRKTTHRSIATFRSLPHIRLHLAENTRMRKSSSLVIVSALLVGLAGLSGCANSPENGQTNASTASAQQEKLIPRDVLFGNPDRAQGKLSHDGKHIGFVAPLDGVLNVWVAPTGDLS